MNVVTKMFRVMMTDVRKDNTERHMAGFIGGVLHTYVC